MSTPALTTTLETWPLATAFNISRGVKTKAEVVIANICDGSHTGRGECVPYTRYGETLSEVADTVRSLAPDIANGLKRADLQLLLPPGAARNALDCALWDLEAKRTGTRVWEIAKCHRPDTLTTAYSLSLDTPEKMAAAATNAADRPILKIKLCGEGDGARIAAIRTWTYVSN